MTSYQLISYHHIIVSSYRIISPSSTIPADFMSHVQFVMNDLNIIRVLCVFYSNADEALSLY